MVDIPEHLLIRSAEARAKALGISVEQALAEMKGESDPTVIYSITQGKHKLKRNLTRKDLKFKSDHNTYVNKGLPPSIIGFPESRCVFIRSDSAAASKTDLVAEPLGHFRSLFINR